MSNDTSRESLDILYQSINKLNLNQRLQKFINLNSTTKNFLSAGILKRHPNTTDDLLRKRMAALKYGRDFTIKYYNWDPEVEGY